MEKNIKLNYKQFSIFKDCKIISEDIIQNFSNSSYLLKKNIISKIRDFISFDKTESLITLKNTPLRQNIDAISNRVQSLSSRVLTNDTVLDKFAKEEESNKIKIGNEIIKTIKNNRNVNKNVLKLLYLFLLTLNIIIIKKNKDLIMRRLILP